MLRGLETTRDYFIHLTQESIGIGTFKSFQTAMEAKGVESYFQNFIGIATGLLSLASPLAMRGITDNNSQLKATLIGSTGGYVDVALLTGVVSISGSLPEALIYKGLVNLGSHAMADAIRFGVNHIRNLRLPAPATLAV